MRELQDLRRGHVLIGANEAAVHVLLPVIEQFRHDHPQARVEVSRRPARQVASRGVESHARLRGVDVSATRAGAAEHFTRGG